MRKVWTAGFALTGAVTLAFGLSAGSGAAAPSAATSYDNPAIAAIRPHDRSLIRALVSERQELIRRLAPIPVSASEQLAYVLARASGCGAAARRAFADKAAKIFLQVGIVEDIVYAHRSYLTARRAFYYSLRPDAPVFRTWVDSIRALRPYFDLTNRAQKRTPDFCALARLPRSASQDAVNRAMGEDPALDRKALPLALKLLPGLEAAAERFTPFLEAAGVPHCIAAEIARNAGVSLARPCSATR